MVKTKRIACIFLSTFMAMTLVLSACSGSPDKKPDNSNSNITTTGEASNGETTDNTGIGETSSTSDQSGQSQSSDTSKVTTKNGTTKRTLSQREAEEEIKKLDLKGASIKFLTHLDANGADARLLKSRFKEYCNGNMVFITQPYEKLGEKLMALKQSGASPDIYGLRNWDFPALMYKDIFQELDSKIDFKSKVWAGDMSKYDQYLWSGKHYIIGGASPMYYIWYNKSMMAEYGIDKDPGQLAKEGKWDWNSFLDIAKKMTDTSSNTYGFVDGGGSLVYALMSSINVDLIKLSSNGIKSNVKSAEMAKALQFYGELYTKHKVTYQTQNALQDFANRKAAMLYDGHWLAQNDPIKKMHDSGEVTFTHIPKAPGAKDYIYPGSVGGYAIPKGAKNMTGAIAFLTMGQVSQAFEKEEREKWYKTSGFNASEIAVYESSTKCINLPTYSYGINEASRAFWTALDQLRGGTPWSTLTAQLEPSVIKAIDNLQK